MFSLPMTKARGRIDRALFFFPADNTRTIHFFGFPHTENLMENSPRPS